MPPANVHLCRRLTLAPCRIHQAALTASGASIALQILQKAFGDGPFPALLVPVESDEQLQSALQNDALGPDAALYRAVQLLVSKACVTGATPALQRSLQLEAWHGLWEVCSISHTSAAVLCRVRLPLCNAQHDIVAYEGDEMALRLQCGKCARHADQKEAI